LAGVPGTPSDLPFVLPRVPASAGALVFDGQGRLLVLEPTYKRGWTIPGGIMEDDGETPWEACRREAAEECGLDLTSGRLVCVDFLRPRPGRAGGIRFVFDCGVLDDGTLAGIVLQEEEIARHRLADLPEALQLLSGPLRRRVRAATKRPQRLRYLEDGRATEGVR
jgi:8-oxo-dGTP pyrophosphatase MutT (NUDIX family)